MTSLLPSESMRKLLADRTQAYSEQLQDSPDAMTYLVEQRGLSEDLVSRLRIGFVAEPLIGDQQYMGRIAIPYIQPAGVTWMKFRTIDNHPKKYLNVPGLESRIYNTPVLRTARKLIITEGKIDAMSFLQIDLQAVAIPGASGWKKAYRRIFRNRQITVFCDGDEAGRKFGEQLQRELWDARIVEAPDGEDANSILVTDGPEALRKRVFGE